MQRLAYTLALLLVVAFTIATRLQSEARTWRSRAGQGGLMGMLLGDGRQMFANQFTAKADQYFHSGYYPSIFDVQSPTAGDSADHVHDENCEHDHKPAAAATMVVQKNDQPVENAHVHGETCGHAHDPAGSCAQGCNHSHQDHSVEACEEKTGGWGKSHDWIARFGSNFRVSEHTHLGGTDRREMLPWLRISAELDPHQINTYLVGSYWLRQVNKSAEAEKFVREGLDANPRNSELYMELAQIYQKDRQNPERAQRLYELALQSWDEIERPKESPNLILLANITSNLARLAESKGDLAGAIGHLERGRQASPHPEVIAKQIEELRLQLNAAAATNSPANR